MEKNGQLAVDIKLKHGRALGAASRWGGVCHTRDCNVLLISVADGRASATEYESD